MAAGPVGRAGALGTDLELEAEIYAYSRSRGLFAGVSVAGAKLSPDRDANRLAYGRAVAPRELLSGRDGPMPPELDAFVRTLERYVPRQARRRGGRGRGDGRPARGP